MRTVYIRGEAEKYENYRRAVEAAGGTVCFGGEAEDCCALLLPGGGDMEPWRYGQENTASRNLEPERDKEELELLEWFVSAGKPVLGICRGIQVINVFFGGTLYQNIEHHAAVDGVDRLHTVRTASSPLLPVCGRLCLVNSAHHQSSARLGRGLEAVQWAEDGTVEALCHRRFPVWGVQWHPERLPGELGGALFRAFLSLCL